MKHLSLWMVLSFSLMLYACAYQPDRQQGHILEPQQIAEVKKGMSPSEVLAILGNPLLKHPFRTTNWIYPYYIWKSDDTEERKHLIIRFNAQNKVAEIIQQ